MNTPLGERHIHIIGAGASGLFAAVELVRSGFFVDLYDRTDRAGTKLLLAGQSGLNITNTEPPENFALRYGAHADLFRSLLADFSPERLRAWLAALGIATFEGSSGKVFPEGMEADGLRSKMIGFLESSGRFAFHGGCAFEGFAPEGGVFVSCAASRQILTLAPPVLLALGGASYPETGSTGEWARAFIAGGIEAAPFKPANMGFTRAWSDRFRLSFPNIAHHPVPLKNIALTFGGARVRGDLMLTDYGIEGSPVYALSREIRDAIESSLPADGVDGCGSAEILIDLFPDLDIVQLEKKVSRPRNKMSSSTYLKKMLGMRREQLALFTEGWERESVAQGGSGMQNGQPLASRLKAVPLSLTGTRPIAEAISSSGGVCFSEVDDSLMLKKKKGIWCAGEMLDWDAPTGGYLLQACFATANRTCAGIAAYIRSLAEE